MARKLYPINLYKVEIALLQDIIEEIKPEKCNKHQSILQRVQTELECIDETSKWEVSSLMVNKQTNFRNFK